MSQPDSPVINIADAKEEQPPLTEYWGQSYKVLTPTMRGRGGKLGINCTRVPPKHTGCPFHTHQLEDEVFYILSGTGVLRYGDELYPLKPGDCISCPAATGIAHQIANTSETEDLVYLAAGNYEPNEVCTYPDSEKVFVRSIKTVGRMAKTPYMDGEPGYPKIFTLMDEANDAG